MPEKAAMDKDRSERADALIARMKKARGYIYPEWEFAARQDPEFVETYNRIYELGLGEGKPGGAPTFHRGLSALMEVAADGAK